MTEDRAYNYATNVSNRQLVLLRELKRTGGIPISRMCELSQTTGGSVVRRGLVAWNAGLQAFVLTPEGLNVIETYTSFDISRTNHESPLSSFIAKKYGRLELGQERAARRSRRAAA